MSVVRIAIFAFLLVVGVSGFRNVGRGLRISESFKSSRQSLSLASVIDLKTPELVFQEQIDTKWAIVDFYADWCGPCKIAAKTFQSIAEEFPDKSVKFIKVDTEVFEDSVDNFGLKGLPVFGVFKDGKLVKKHEGNIGKEKLLEFIESGMQM
jgi:thioredoxin 1